MRDVIFALIIFGSLPVCFRRPLIGLLMFSWLAYMRTQHVPERRLHQVRGGVVALDVTATSFLDTRLNARGPEPGGRLSRYDLFVVTLVDVTHLQLPALPGYDPRIAHLTA